jgi:hypothetical protein
MLNIGAERTQDIICDMFVDACQTGWVLRFGSHPLGPTTAKALKKRSDFLEPPRSSLGSAGLCWAPQRIPRFAVQDILDNLLRRH